MGFPHALFFPLAMISDGVLAIWATLLALDIGLVTAAYRALPAKLTRFQAAQVLGTWLALSVATVLAAPYLAVWAWEAWH